MPLRHAIAIVILLAGLAPAISAENCPNWKPEPDMREGIVKHCWGPPYGTRKLTLPEHTVDVHIYYRGGRQFRVNYINGRVFAIEELGPG